MFLAIVAKLLTSASWSNPRLLVLKGLPEEVWLVYYHSGPANAKRAPHFCKWQKYLQLCPAAGEKSLQQQVLLFYKFSTQLSKEERNEKKRFAFKTLDPRAEKYYVTTLQVRAYLSSWAGFEAAQKRKFPWFIRRFETFHSWKKKKHSNPSSE